ARRHRRSGHGFRPRRSRSRPRGCPARRHRSRPCRGRDREALVTPEPAGLASLYPFLYETEGRGDDALLAEVEVSTSAKIRETLTLRDGVLRSLEERLVDCARVLADRFSAGGRLFTFGNGGSATDAQAVAQLFLQPPAGRAVPASSL